MVREKRRRVEAYMATQWCDAEEGVVRVGRKPSNESQLGDNEVGVVDD
jgi:hypothetical protein